MNIDNQSSIVWTKESITDFVKEIYTLYKMFPNKIYRDLNSKNKTRNEKYKITKENTRKIRSLYSYWVKNKQNKQLYEEACNKCTQ